MISFKDLVEKGPKESGMPSMESLDPKKKEEVKGLLEKAKMILAKAGVEDPAEWIQNYCGEMGMDTEMSEDDMPESEEEDEDKGKRASLIIALLKKKDGSEAEDEEE